jgi:hypothetical protein
MVMITEEEVSSEVEGKKLPDDIHADKGGCK